jgi:integrative and conjugative element protein (TIGR02256 family)
VSAQRSDHPLAKGRLWLAADVLARMADEAARIAPLESGGVLLGWHEPEGRDLMVSTFVGPGPRASHKRTRFVPDSAWQDEQIARLYEEHGRVLGYIGDWHSHPGGTSTPSRRDERTARKIARRRAARCSNPLMLILSGGPAAWRPTPHRYVDGRLREIGWEVVAEPDANRKRLAGRRVEPAA